MFAGALMLGSRPIYNVTLALNRGEWQRTVDAPLIPSSQPVILNITISPGIEIQSASTAKAALNFDGLAAGSTVNLFNAGYAIGKGGAAGAGGGLGGAAGAGLDGGPAIKGPGSGRTLNITNASGRIWAGGGGGGGGGGSTSNQRGGGGGGGGAGGGALGTKGAGNLQDGSDGAAGTTGSVGAAGAGGAGVGGSGNGGNGGAYGAAASAGSAGTGFAGGALGASGLAIDLNIGSATFISGSGSPNVKGSIA